MEHTKLFYAAIMLAGVFIGAVSQVLLKKAALRPHASRAQEYLNPQVIIAYTLFLGTTFLTVYAYREIPLSLGPLLEATSYFYVTFFGVTIFHEKLNRRKIIAIACIFSGIAVYSILG